jgi:two-component system, LytTR family, response regulator LytT
MKLLIVEDEAPALQRMLKLVKDAIPEAVIMGTADSILSAVQLIQKHADIELILMDIELADGRSFEIFKRVTVSCPVIFTTAYDEFALEAFKVNSIDYLLKPVDLNELQAAIVKFKTLNRGQQDYKEQFEQLLRSFTNLTPQFKQRFLVKVGVKLISIAVEEIALFYAADKLVYVVTQGQQKYPIDHTLEELFTMLNPDYFFQVNRKVIANVKSIQGIHTYFNGKLKLDLTYQIGEDVLVSREKAPEFKKWLNR